MSKNAAIRRERPARVRHAELAPRWHTWGLVAFIVVGAAIGFASTLVNPPAATSTRSASPIATIYLPLLAVQWGLVGYVALVGQRMGPRKVFADLLGRTWRRPHDALGDLAVAGLAVFLIAGVEASAHLLGASHSASVVALLPSSVAERAVWWFVAANVALCEELVFRGYLQSQLSAWMRSTTAAIALQALLFGLAHGEQGLAAVPRMAVYGAILGVIAATRGSLLPAILAHGTIDVLAGLRH